MIDLYLCFLLIVKRHSLINHQIYKSKGFEQEKQTLVLNKILIFLKTLHLNMLNNLRRFND